MRALLSTPGRLSRWTVLALFAVLCVMRVASLTPNELSWDVFGYYLYLPATVIHHDPLLHDTAWIHEVMRTHEVSGTLYQLSTAPDNSTPIYFFLMGMALCYAPFFLLGHGIALITGAPADGFSAPYQVSVALGCMAYVLIGLVHLRRILLQWSGDGVAAATIAVIVLGTNYLQFATAKDLETANFLFCWMAVLVWNTLRWHAEQRRANLLWIAGSIALITLIKPSEIVCGIIPLAWGVYDRASLRAKARLLAKHGKDLLLAVGLGLCVLAPQLLYWKVMTGDLVHDSYKNPGVGLDLLRPHIGDVLFSFRKGWLIYTPVMAFALAGLVPLYRRRRPVFWAVMLYAAVAFYILASWSEWWYGASYSVRPMITLYVVLALPLALALEAIGKATLPVRALGIGTVTALVALNGFQLWQFRSWIIHPYRTTRPYYFAVFGRTAVPPGAEALLSLDRSFDGSDRMGDPSQYDAHTLGAYDFEDTARFAGRLAADTVQRGHVLVLDAEHPFSPNVEMPYTTITDKPYFWAKARVRVQVPQGYAGEPPCLVLTMERKEGSYGYRTFCATADSTRDGGWTTLEGAYLTPPIRDTEDRFKVYVWHRGQAPIRVDDLVVDVFVPR